MAASKGHYSTSKNQLSLKAKILALCFLHLSGVSGQVVRSLTRPALLQTNGLNGFQNSDLSNFALDLGVQSSAGLGRLNTANGGARFPPIGSVSGASTLPGYNTRTQSYPEIYTAIGKDQYDEERFSWKIIYGVGASTLPGYNTRTQSYPEIYTAIGKDQYDEESQMRLTITERFSNSRFSSFDSPTDWYVQGTFFNSQMRNKAGNYYVVLTSGGRTADGCDGSTLGQLVGTTMSNSNPSGMLPNHLTMGASGPTVYASTLEGISRRQLVGGAIAACESISSDGLCSGNIPFCATISKDLFQAMEVPVEHQVEIVDPMPNVVPFDSPIANTAGTLPGLGDILGSSLGNNMDGLGLAINNPMAFNNNDKPAGREQESPKAVGLLV
ncbi:hypothetical protein EGW08_012727 [Elysia chlorotica]|uniref:Uncharacterized protein n=1 Tax=Elysia chlorotica TaxID=188477 RepID=A0A3S0ZI88_ELYCH|nr:hypothetical protein EGW08_012727 [Elysia chlorotica]